MEKAKDMFGEGAVDIVECGRRDLASDGYEGREALFSVGVYLVRCSSFQTDTPYVQCIYEF